MLRAALLFHTLRYSKNSIGKHRHRLLVVILTLIPLFRCVVTRFHPSVAPEGCVRSVLYVDEF